MKREKWKEWNSKLTKALKCPSSLKNTESVLLFERIFFSCIAAFSVASSYRIREMSLSVMLMGHSSSCSCPSTSHTAFCTAASFLSSLCGIMDHEMVLPKTRGSACLVCNSSARQSGTDKVRFLGYLLQRRSVGIAEMKSQR